MTTDEFNHLIVTVWNPIVGGIAAKRQITDENKALARFVFEMVKHCDVAQVERAMRFELADSRVPCLRGIVNRCEPNPAEIRDYPLM